MTANHLAWNIIVKKWGTGQEKEMGFGRGEVGGKNGNPFYDYFYVHHFSFQNHAQHPLTYSRTLWPSSNDNKCLQGSYLHDFWIPFLGHNSGPRNIIWNISSKCIILFSAARKLIKGCSCSFSLLAWLSTTWNNTQSQLQIWQLLLPICFLNHLLKKKN